MTRTATRMVLLLGCVLVLPACAINQKPIVHQPMSTRPVPVPMPGNDTGGSIYQNASFRPLFEDRRARFVGDTVIIRITENTAASKSSKANAERNGSISASVPTIQSLPGKTFQGIALDAETASTFDGGGGANATNAFTGTITCTVIEVYPNGNLLVSGEKQIAMSQGTEFIRFSGVINPVMIGATNSVSSTQVADARIEYRANGYIDEAQTMGWLARFFNNVMPF